MGMTSLDAWSDLESLATSLLQTHLVKLFADDPDRVNRYNLTVGGLCLDYSKNLINDDVLRQFSALSQEAGLPGKITEMFNGQRINNTEDRAALHTLLRATTPPTPALVESHTEVRETLSRIKVLSDTCANGDWKGFSGETITDLVHIGIGGSYLGPRMIDTALEQPVSARLQCHFVANVDAHHLLSTLEALNPATTAVLVVSKTFSTQEAITNAHTARRWLLGAMETSDLAKHLIAISTNLSATSDFGVAPENVLPMWDWVGGRYSLWSAVGLPIALKYGYQAFEALLAGAAEMDEHFRTAPLDKNMPHLLASLENWYQNFWAAGSHAVLTYDHRLRLFPDHLQQLDMESNGKSVMADGEKVTHHTGPIVWGGEGTNGQHAYHQLLHQGTHFTCLDFILTLMPDHAEQDHHDKLVANCFSQAQALMVGRPQSALQADSPLVAQHRAMPGNRPSNMLMINKLNAHNLGALVALYEHKVFCSAVMWGINPFDQWGVELGKELGENILTMINADADISSVDASTASLIERYKATRG